MRRTPTIERFAELVSLIVKGPRTVSELCDLLGGPARHTVYGQINALHAEGLVYVSDWRGAKGCPAPVYAWQPRVAELRDVPRYAASKGSSNESV